MSDPLEGLAVAVNAALSGRPRRLGWGDPAALSPILAALRLRFGARQRRAARLSRVAHAVLAFRVQGRAQDFVQLKYACRGLADPLDWESRRLVDDERLLGVLVQQVMALAADPRRFAVCCRELAHARQVALSDPRLPLSPKALALLAQVTEISPLARN